MMEGAIGYGMPWLAGEEQDDMNYYDTLTQYETTRPYTQYETPLSPWGVQNQCTRPASS